MPAVRILLPRPHAFQQSILDHPARHKVVTAGRRTGKSVVGRHALVVTALRGQPAAYLAPTFTMARRMWKDLCRILAPVTAEKSEQEKALALHGGGSVRVFSLAEFDRVRGEHFGLVVIDEAAMVPDLEEAWTQAIRATLMDLRGRSMFLSTPRGRNFFWQLFQRGDKSLLRDGEKDPWPAWKSFHAPTSINPFISAADIEEMRLELPERAFLQEVLARFLDFEGAIFRNVLDCSTVDPLEFGERNHTYVMGADWARSGDYTALAVYDLNTRSLVHLDRFTGLPFSAQQDRVVALYDRFRPQVIVAEANSFGQTNIEALQARGLPVQPFVTTNASKISIIDALALAFERKDISIPADPVLQAELMAMEAKKTPSGQPKYEAAQGHDDTVIALALAYHAAANHCDLGTAEGWW